MTVDPPRLVAVLALFLVTYSGDIRMTWHRIALRRATSGTRVRRRCSGWPSTRVRRTRRSRSTCRRRSSRRCTGSTSSRSCPTWTSSSATTRYSTSTSTLLYFTLLHSVASHLCQMAEVKFPSINQSVTKSTSWKSRPFEGIRSIATRIIAKVITLTHLDMIMVYIPCYRYERPCPAQLVPCLQYNSIIYSYLVSGKTCHAASVDPLHLTLETCHSILSIDTCISSIFLKYFS